MSRRASAAVLLACGTSLLGCGPSEPAPKDGHATVAPAGVACPAGQSEGAGLACVPIGPQGCAAAFLGQDGLCRPSVASCPAGTIPRFDQGCVPVGIAQCAAIFVAADGLCRPTMTACPTGAYAVPSLGCVSIDGDGCGEAPWGTIADEPQNLYVDPAAPLGGAGDRAAPSRPSPRHWRSPTTEAESSSPQATTMRPSS